LATLNEFDIPLIEDTAQAHGSKLGEKYMGTFGKVGCFSTHDRKLLSTGEGGYILTDDERLYDKMKQFSQLGYMDGKTYGVNHKLSALQAALGTHRLPQMPTQIEKRQSYVKLIEKTLQNTEIKIFPVEKDGSPNYYSLVIILPWDKKTNFKFIQNLDEQGIPSDILKYGFCPIYKRPMFTDLVSKCPNTEWLIDHMTTIPIHPGLKKSEVTYMAEAIISAYKVYKHD